jgi:hypothetical protein
MNDCCGVCATGSDSTLLGVVANGDFVDAIINFGLNG